MVGRVGWVDVGTNTRAGWRFVGFHEKLRKIVKKNTFYRLTDLMMSRGHDLWCHEVHEVQKISKYRVYGQQTTQNFT
jgi:hypothetical protein